MESSGTDARLSSLFSWRNMKYGSDPRAKSQTLWLPLSSHKVSEDTFCVQRIKALVYFLHLVFWEAFGKPPDPPGHWGALMNKIPATSWGRKRVSSLWSPRATWTTDLRVCPPRSPPRTPQPLLLCITIWKVTRWKLRLFQLTHGSKEKTKQIEDYLTLTQTCLISKHKNTFLYVFTKNFEVTQQFETMVWDLWGQASKREFKSEDFYRPTPTWPSKEFWNKIYCLYNAWSKELWTWGYQAKLMERVKCIMEVD